MSCGNNCQNKSSCKCGNKQNEVCGNNKYALPGIQNPVVPKNFNSRVFSEADGSIKLKILGPCEIRDDFPDIEVFISSEFTREVENIASIKDCLIFSELDASNPQYENYYLRVSTDELKLGRGTYTLRVIIDETHECVYTLTVRNHPKYVNRMEYNWLPA